MEIQEMENSPLVSIIVITYNSSKYILETLESAKTQTYKNIELIISDDCSTDDTMAICENWLDKNYERFNSTKLVIGEINTGVAANCNRGVINSNGKWVKIIAGDDVLNKNAVHEFLTFAENKKNSIIVSKLELFNHEGTINEGTIAAYEKYNEKIKKGPKDQRKRILKEYYVPGPALFFSRKLYDLVNGFDELYPFSEEWPFVLRAINKGYPILLIGKKLVRYRISNESLSRKGTGLDLRTFNSNRDFFFNERRNLLIKNWMFFTAIDQTRHYYYHGYKNFKTSSNLLKVIFWSIISPKLYFTILKKCFND